MIALTGTTSPQLLLSAGHPILHFLPSGNYVSCNMYWSIGLDCPHCERETEDAETVDI